ncbi:substrate-binding periplasmic protein [Rheinheimera maricola]|nr:transporter substrate-binding domain-containing protein [Rheinheimera maricola]
MFSKAMLLIAFFCAGLGAQTPASLLFLTEHSPPGQYLDAQGQVAGVTVELIRHLQQQLQEPGEFRLLPWGRALSMARTGESTALFETVRTPERENWFKWVGPLLHYQISLYGLRQRLGIAASELKLPGKLIACSYRNAVTAKDIMQFGFEEGRNLVLTSRSGECLDMLIAGRIDVMAITEYSLPGFALEVKQAGYELTRVQYLTERKRYLAFSKDVADERITRWQQALEQSYRDGTMRSLYQPVYAEAIILRLEDSARQTP